ncbi:MAG TPA: hypothetical protein VG737_01620 [Cyclobacteriaceae bacterium]|nr:hypothetical protein [Cyclobacteriaceae bacterium]
MRLLLILCALAFTLTGCPPGCGVPESIGACGVADPVENLPWLKIEIQALKSSSLEADYTVSQATYKGNTVFWISICCPTCDVAPPTIKKCDGNVAGQLTVDIQNSELSNTREIWKTNNGFCH